ncbi:MAG TPA: TIGR04551 family protein [Polyangia bacterium]
MRRQAILALLAAALCAASARADDAADEAPLRTLQMTPSPWRSFRLTLDGYYRVRGDVFNDLDLSRGPSPSTGQPIFPLPAAGGNDHTITAADMRLRLEPTLEIGQAVRLHLRVDLLDNLGWGSTPDVLPSTSEPAFAATRAEPPETGINALESSVRVKQAWGEVTLPFGTLAAGRMGGLVSWGTGFFINNGDCLGCDDGDSGDRVALTVPVLGHYITALYELSASGPYVSNFGQDLDVERRAQVNTVALAISRVRSTDAQLRRLRSGRTLVQYGLLASYRRQDLDAPGWTQPGGLTRTFGPNDFVGRGLQSFAGDLWFMIHHHGLRAELEVATVLGQIDDATNAPGVSFRGPITSKQVGGVASLAYSFEWPIRLRVEVGYASGDDAPGFGNRIANGQLTTQPGDLDGPQARPPVDYSIDNFRFSPDYHVDLILWRRILGQVTDAVYIKPTVRLGPFGSAWHHITFDASVIESNSVYATTPPGQNSYLGTELDLQARYRYEAGFEIDAGYGLLFPGAGFRNIPLKLDPQTAQTLEIILAYRI